MKIFVGIVVLVGVVVVGFVLWQGSERKMEPVACTQEAKVCPDGSAVGREGPNCEFPACPGESL